MIAVYGNRVAMQPTLEGAIKGVFGGLPAGTPAAAAPAATAAPSARPPSEDLIGRVRKEFRQAEEALKKGQWSEFGRAMDDLSRTLGK